MPAREKTRALKTPIRVPPALWERFVRRLECLLESVLRDRRADGVRILAAVSGGPDSIALAHLLARARSTYKYEMAICSVDHRVRSAPERARDAALVRRCADALQVPFILERVDCGNARDENSLRRARYEALTRAAIRMRCSILALGHTLDDAVETFLFNLMRGAGLRGLRGIPPVRRLASGITAIRPLLDVRRAELHAFLRTAGIRYAVDSTNRSDAYTRNRIRRTLVPLMERLVPGAAAHIAQAARHIADADDALEAIVGRCLRLHEELVVVQSGALRPFPDGVRGMVMHRALELAARQNAVRLQSSRGPLVARLCGLLEGGMRSVPLKARLAARRRGTRILIGPPELLR